MPQTPDGHNYMSKEFLNNLNPQNFSTLDREILQLENRIIELEKSFKEMNEKLKGILSGK